MKGKEGGGKAWEDKRDEGRAMELEPQSCCEYLSRRARPHWRQGDLAGQSSKHNHSDLPSF